MKIPIVMSTVHAQVDAEGRVAIDVDGEPYGAGVELGRNDLRRVVNEIATCLGTAVRVEVHEADGSTFDDIAIPPDSAPSSASATGAAPAASPSLDGSGFQPGEQVALAYVLSRQTADASGRAAINLPPALLAASRSGLVLLGLTSQTFAPVEATP